MNSRERLTRCYFNKELDRPAIYSRTGYPVNDPSYDKLKQYLYEHTEMKLGWHARAYETPYPAESYVEPVSEDFERDVTILHTPLGDLTSSAVRSLRGRPMMHETFYIKTREDAEKYLSLPMPDVYGDVSSFFTAEKKIGDKGIVDISLNTNAAGSTVKLIGSENFAIMSITDRDIIHALCERHAKIIMNAAKFLIDNKVGPFFSMSGHEYIVPPLHGEKDFYDFNVKYDKPIVDLIHNAGGRVHVHCHGSIKKVLKGFLDEGIDVLHPFEAPQMGDITASEAKNIVRDKICIEGNIQISHMYEHTPEEILEETKQLIKDAFDDHKGLIVSPTASPYINDLGLECFNNYKAMIDAVLEWKV